jgi:hypothetical protein
MADSPPSAAEATRRLEELARRARAARKPRTVNMSADAVEQRLRALGALHRACAILAAAGRRAGLGRPPRDERPAIADDPRDA